MIDVMAYFKSLFHPRQSNGFLSVFTLVYMRWEYYRRMISCMCVKEFKTYIHTTYYCVVDIISVSDVAASSV